MKILHKYVLKEHLGPLVFSLTTLTSLLLLNYIAKRFGELVGKGLEWTVIAKFFGLSIPFTVALTFPMAVLVSTLYAFSRLAAENEITALKASGVSLRSILTPVMLAAFGITLFMIVFNDQIMPRSNHTLAKLQMDIAQKKPTFALREQVINDVQPGRLYLRANHLDEGSNRMREVTIYDLNDPTRRRTIFADSGMLAMAPNRTDLLMTLYDGEMQDIPTDDPVQLQRLFFQTDLIVVRGVTNQFRQDSASASKGNREMTVCEMQQEVQRLEEEYRMGLENFTHNLERARSTNAKLSPEIVKFDTTSPSGPSLGTLYCKMLASIGLKELGAQEPNQRDNQELSQHVNSIEPDLGQRATSTSYASANSAQDTSQKPAVRDTIRKDTLHRDSVRRDTTVRKDTSRKDTTRNDTIRKDIRTRDSARQAAGTLRPPLPPGTFTPPPLPTVQPTPTPTPAPAPNDPQGSAQNPQQPRSFPRGITLDSNGRPVRPVPDATSLYNLDAGMLESDRSTLMLRKIDIAKYDVEIHKKFALAVACFVFALLGAPIAIRFPRGGVGMTIGVSLVIFALYYVGLIAGASLATEGHIPAWIAMWAANVIFFLVAVYLLSRMGKEGSTSRGGDVQELIENIKLWFTRRFRSSKLIVQERDAA